MFSSSTTMTTKTHSLNLDQNSDQLKTFLYTHQPQQLVYYRTWLKKLVYLIYLDMRQWWSRRLWKK
ncbi:hypothetical protein HMI54_013846 [Coelomomyces lativittatus]|nr:hypothetical protein HMI54_013846 [Coelomomyces lativittatus]